MEPMLVPPWLESLLSTPFFSMCQTHFNIPRNECNMYCLDCKGIAFCFYCRSSCHKDHQVIQIRRSSYHDVVRVTEIQKVLDMTGVQTYVINSARVVFLNERPQPKTNPSGGKTTSHLCETCGRSLLDPLRFCSLGCKVAEIKKNGNGSFVLSAKKDEEEEVGRRKGMLRRLPTKQVEEIEEEEDDDEELREGIIKKQVYQNTPCQTSASSQSYSNSRRRKGVPHRAPFGP
ncbi:PLATZ transcription factor family protein [Quillaja saponaria]|uniref:PLATZ transcription factor family protein n=1 Tax=Quillaja saponaria TaxID=32244 RepID=A0AAD7QGW5_QUISA|nr:PLATZ transcription factor family protein [Quillaja saponaria]